MNHDLYLSNIPQTVEKNGICKTLLVRREIIHIKHIFTEIFQRKTILDFQFKLNKIDYNLFDYMEVMTRVIRKIHLFSRDYRMDMDKIIKQDRNSFFKNIQLYNGLKNIIALDFDGTITSQKFHELYKLCIKRGVVFVVTANPTVNEQYFLKHNLPLPSKIYACKGKVKKIRKLIELQKVFDQVFYVDNETEYLDYMWLFGVKTFHYSNGKIIYYSLKTK